MFSGSFGSGNNNNNKLPLLPPAPLPISKLLLNKGILSPVVPAISIVVAQITGVDDLDFTLVDHCATTRGTVRDASALGARSVRALG